MQNISESTIVVGCNYHTKWQKNPAMRFVLKEIKKDKARLITRKTGRDFWTNIADLIFIMSKHNIDKAKINMNKLKMNYRINDIVLYNGKKSIIQNINEDGTCNIINPDYDYDLEKECHINNIEYGIQYCLNVSLLELTPIKINKI